jgi:hypothetical protein
MEIFVGTMQGVTKDCVAGDRLMNRYVVFNGLNKPRRINSNLQMELLGIPQATVPTLGGVIAGGLTTGKWYAWVAVYASTLYNRPTPATDGSSDMIRGNPSTSVSVLLAGTGREIVVTNPNQDGITTALIYRSLGASTQAEAEAGPFYYSGKADYSGAATVTVSDTTADNLLGLAVEQDNYEPPAYRYAIAASSYIFIGGNFSIGSGVTCSVTPGSPLVSGGADIFYDGIDSWTFKLLGDSTGGIGNSGMYYCEYVDAHTLRLLDASGVPMNYSGSASGAGQQFMCYIPGNVLRWSKRGEPESYPALNLIQFEGDITGIAQVPNQPILLVFTDSPSCYALDLTLIGTDTFKTRRRAISTTNSVTSHYSLVAVDSLVRGIDARRQCILESDGTRLVDISGQFVPRIWEHLSNDENLIKLWHCAYDQTQSLFSAFVTFRGSHRIIDFAIGQNTLTGGWFFNFEKDLLCSYSGYIDDATGESMTLGGTEGIGQGYGGVWGRIWTPGLYSEWIPTESVLSGVLTAGTSTTLTIDLSGGPLVGDLSGRWVLVSDANGEYAQVAYIRSNTADTITIQSVVGGALQLEFSPVPAAGYKFYLGLIEMRWGPKRFDWGDSDVPKKVWEVLACCVDHNEDDPPFVRIYRGFEYGYTSQLKMGETRYLDRTQAQTLVNKVDHKLEAVPRWGMAILDRSYGPTEFHSLTVVFNRVQAKGKQA